MNVDDNEFHWLMIAYHQSQFDYYYCLQYSIAQPDSPYVRPDIRGWIDPIMDAAWIERLKHASQYNT